MNVLVFDCETESHNTGAWTDPRNFLVALAYDDICVRPTEIELQRFQKRVDEADVLVAFNAKFDLHWLRKYGINFNVKRVHDVQYAAYLLSSQRTRFPSLDGVALQYLNERKIDKIKEYWDQGILTSQIPWDELHEYAIQDVALTRKLYELLVIPESQRVLFSLCMQDLIGLLEMESHGIKFNREGSLKKADECDREIKEIQERNNLAHGIPDFNWGSPDQIAALLFGGSLFRTRKVPAGLIKSGPNKGKPKFKNEEVEYRLKKRYTPIGKTPGGKPSTDDDTLVKLGNDGLVGDIIRIRKLTKETGTYLRGLPKQQDVGMYGHEYIYGQFNQCATVSGRLSSSNPNLQNQTDLSLTYFVSRYD